MQSTHAQGWMVLVICCWLPACGATTEHNPDRTSDGGSSQVPRNAGAGAGTGAGGASGENLTAADTMALFAQAPHCTGDTSYLLEGNIDAASAVELASTGVMNGDLKAGTLTVSAGSRMRGRVEFGWDPTGASSPKTGKEGSGA